MQVRTYNRRLVTGALGMFIAFCYLCLLSAFRPPAEECSQSAPNINLLPTNQANPTVPNDKMFRRVTPVPIISGLGPNFIPFTDALLHRPDVGEVAVVSFIIPCYKQFSTLGLALESIFSNDPSLASFEVVVVNDGTPTPGAFERFQQKYRHEFPSRVSPANATLAQPGKVLFLDKPNGGLSDARNEGITRTSGEWLLVLDADDQISPLLLTKTHLAISSASHGKDTLLTTKYNVIAPDLNTWKIPALTKSVARANPFHCSVFYRRRLWERSPYRNAFFFGWEDWAFWLRANVTQPNGLVPLLLEEPLVMYSQGSMHLYCSGAGFILCRSLFITANAEFFDRKTLGYALRYLVSSQVPFYEHERYKSVMTQWETEDSVIALWHALELMAQEVSQDEIELGFRLDNAVYKSRLMRQPEVEWMVWELKRTMTLGVRPLSPEETVVVRGQ